MTTKRLGAGVLPSGGGELYLPGAFQGFLGLLRASAAAPGGRQWFFSTRFNGGNWQRGAGDFPAVLLCARFVSVTESVHLGLSGGLRPVRLTFQLSIMPGMW